MVDNVSSGAFIRSAAVVSAEVNIHLPVLELLPGQGQWMAAAVAKENSTKQIIPMHPGRTAMFCPDFFCLLVDFSADDWLMSIRNDHTAIFVHLRYLAGFVIHNFCLKQSKIT